MSKYVLLFTILAFSTMASSKTGSVDEKWITEQWKYPAEAETESYEGCLSSFEHNNEITYRMRSTGAKWTMIDATGLSGFSIVPGKIRMWTRSIRLVRKNKAYEVAWPKFLRDSSTTVANDIATDNYGVDFKIKFTDSDDVFYLACVQSVVQSLNEGDRISTTCEVFKSKPKDSKAQKIFMGKTTYAKLFDETSPTLEAKELSSFEYKNLKKDLRSLIFQAHFGSANQEKGDCLKVKDPYLQYILRGLQSE